MSWVATAVVGSAVIGAGASIFGASKGADAQKNAANQAAAIQQQQYQQTRADLAPYRDIGDTATGQLKSRLSELTAPVSIDPNALENSDYYKFAMQQGQKAVTNSAAARGLGTSGAALKGAAAFAKGLSTDTYKTAFDMAQTNQKNAYDRLMALVQTGAGAAAGTGALGEKAAYNTGTAVTAAGNAEAGADNKIGNSISGLANNIGGYAMYRGLYGSGSGAGGGNFNYVSAPGGGYMPMATG